MNKEIMNIRPDEEEDRKAFELWIKGDKKGFSILYEKYKSRIFGFILRMTGNREVAEDLLQETFLAALRNRDQFDRSRSFLSWLFGIAHKRTIDYFRHSKVETEHTEEAEKVIGDIKTEPDEEFEKKKIREMIREAVDKLDPLQKEVFLLRELAGVPFKEIAVIMNCPLNTALGRMRLALINIRKELKKRGVNEL
ncbi:MAG: sigma-70 family RNA polymerase sigma factor [Chitinispirillaceae bacterium]|nr:sigma-70 family RNA polymerase sigma factor [Chitinispirillaceae bacterium]